MSNLASEFEQLCNRAVALRKAGRAGEALPLAQQALAIIPENVSALRILASIHRALNQHEQGIEVLKCAAKLDPNDVKISMTLGNALESARRYTEAAAAFEAASRVDPNLVDAYFARGAALARVGRLDDAQATFRQALSRNPNDAALHSNVLFGELYSPGATDDPLRIENEKWWASHGESLSRLSKPHVNDRSADRLIRVGYVSPHFREHPISFFIEPIMRARSASVKSFWYSDVAIPDATTNRLRALIENWCDSSAMNDEHLDARIRLDGIDILVDLSQHLSHNRMALFARKPAPIQIAYLGYPYSTGLHTMDFRVGDSYLDPTGTASGPEKLLRLSSYFCYSPPSDAPSVAARSNNPFIFGSMNQLMKINSPTIDAWSRVLQAMPNSRLLIKAKGTEDPLARERYWGAFTKLGIDRTRVEFSGFSPLVDAMREMSERVDVVLDTLPYPGGTTSCHLLWLGIPVVTIAGELPIHRLGVSVLQNVACPELIAGDVDEFVSIATSIEPSPYRATLRERMRASRLMDADRFNSELENLYRQIWQTWCA